MPEQSTDAAAKLKKLGERIRAGIAKRHPIADKSLDIVRQTVREEWQREQTAKRSKPPITRAKTRDRKPPEPER
jgi:hypothetical protein